MRLCEYEILSASDGRPLWPDTQSCNENISRRVVPLLVPSSLLTDNKESRISISVLPLLPYISTAVHAVLGSHAYGNAAKTRVVLALFPHCGKDADLTLITERLAQTSLAGCNVQDCETEFRWRSDTTHRLPAFENFREEVMRQFAGLEPTVNAACRWLHEALSRKRPQSHVIFYGPSGGGKTLLARSLAGTSFFLWFFFSFD